MKCGAFSRKEEVQRFPHRHIEFKSPDGHVLRSNREMRGAFRFARCPGLLDQEFRSYLADFSRLREAEAASYVGWVTKCEVRDALKQIDLNKSPGLDGLPYEVYEDFTYLSLF